MAGFNYAAMQDKADTLLDRFKQGTVTLLRVTPGTPDPDEPWVPVDDTTVTYALKATVRSVEDRYVDGTTIFATDSMVTASPIMTKTHEDGDAVANVETELEVLPGDDMAIDGKVVTIVKTMRVPKAGTAVVWKFITRG